MACITRSIGIPAGDEAAVLDGCRSAKAADRCTVDAGLSTHAGDERGMELLQY